MGGSVSAGRQIGEGAAPHLSYDGEEKEERAVIEKYKGGGGDDHSVDSNVEGSMDACLLLAAEGCAYAVLVRGRGTDGRDVTKDKARRNNSVGSNAR